MSYTGGRQPRRSCAPRALCLAILALASASGFCRSASDTSAPGGFPSSSSPPRKTLDQEIGSPSELAWQAWLLVENKGGGHASALDSSNILRRITPKSIFIAPELVSCPSGYSPDGKGICKPDPIDFNEDAQKVFLLKRLNALYGKGGSNRKKPEASGPLQINIPISLPAKGSPPEGQPVQSQSEQQAASQSSSQAPASPQELPTAHRVDMTESVNRVAIPVVISQHVPLNDNNKNQDAVAVVIYNVANDTKKVQKSDDGVKTSFFLGTANTSGAKKDLLQNGHVVPVAEIVDEMNETFSGVVDYKIPISLKTAFNATRLPEKKGQSDSSEDMSPTMVLLLSPTKVPFTTTSQQESEPSKMVGFSQSSQNRDTEEIDSTTAQTTEEETKSDMDTTIHTVAPLGMQKPVEPMTSTAKSTDRYPEKSYTQDKSEDETMYADEESQTEVESEDHEDYEETTDEADQDDFGESEDEILKPGEAGMTIPSKNRDLVKTKNHKHHLSTVSVAEDPTSTITTDATTMPAFTTVNLQDAFDASDSTAKTDATDSTKETVMTTETTEVPSTIMTTEPSTEETTLYTTKLVRSDSWMKATTRKSPTTIPITTTIDDRERTETQGFFETERDLVTEPEVIFSTQGSHGMMTNFGRKKPAHPAKTIDVPYTIADFEDVVIRTEPPPVLGYHRRDPTDQFRQRPSVTVNDEPIIFKNDDSLPSEFRDQLAESSRPSSTDFRGISGHINDESSTYVRFPEHLSEIRSQPGGFVRFPSDEVNSIHNQDNFKDHLLSAYRTREDYGGNASPSSTKSSVPARQKSAPTHWRIPPPGMRTDRQQQQLLNQQLQTGPSGQRQQKQKPMLLRFWARMPLVRDLSFYPTTSHGSHNEPIGGPEGQRRGQARRAGHYKEMSSHEVNRLLAQQLGQPAIGG